MKKRWLSALAVALLLPRSGQARPPAMSLPFEAPPPATRATLPSQAYEVGGNSLGIATGDFNGDGARDIVVTNRGVYDPHTGGYTGEFVSVLLGNRDGTFAPQRRIETSGVPRGVVTADFNGDGREDLAIAFLNGAGVGVYVSRGDGTFVTPVDCPP